MFMDKDTRVYEKSSVQTLAESIAGARTKRQRNRCHHRSKREHWEIMDNEVLVFEKSGDEYTLWIRGERYHAYVSEASKYWLVYLRHAESEHQAGKKYMERYRKHKERISMGRPLHVGGEVDRSTEGNGVHK